MKSLLIIALLILTITFQSDISLAGSEMEFENYMNNWNEKRELASKYLLEAENAFKNGDELEGCVTQQRAGEYGTEATLALIKAMETKNEKDGLLTHDQVRGVYRRFDQSIRRGFFKSRRTGRIIIGLLNGINPSKLPLQNNVLECSTINLLFRHFP